MTLDSLGKNIPALDGLRAFAVLAVILLHGEVPFCKGGFIGVEVFFVLSGFLITALLLLEAKAHGGIKLSHFYFRRALRLLPALVVMVGVVTPLALYFLPAEWRTGILLDTLAALLYFQNWAWGLDWLPPGIYGHTWSLSIEEQFYIAWPPVVVAMLFFKLRPKGRATLTGVIALTALLWASYNAGKRPWQHSYFLTDLRIGSLLLGCFLATLIHAGAFARVPSKYIRASAALGLGALAFGVWIGDAYHAHYYRYGIPLVGITTSAVLLEILRAPEGSLGQFLGKRALVWIGRRSYGIYLWHFPIIVPLKEWGWGWEAKTITALILTPVVAELSYRFVEMPFLRFKKRFSRKAPESGEPSPAAANASHEDDSASPTAPGEVTPPAEG